MVTDMTLCCTEHSKHSASDKYFVAKYVSILE